MAFSIPFESLFEMYILNNEYISNNLLNNPVSEFKNQLQFKDLFLNKNISISGINYDLSELDYKNLDRFEEGIFNILKFDANILLLFNLIALVYLLLDKKLMTREDILNLINNLKNKPTQDPCDYLGIDINYNSICL